VRHDPRLERYEAHADAMHNDAANADLYARLDGSSQVPRHQQTRDSLMDHIFARLDMNEWDGAPVR
jgi:acid stress-induced BolA-like protein IbaG/YrbA